MESSRTLTGLTCAVICAAVSLSCGDSVQGPGADTGELVITASSAPPPLAAPPAAPAATIGSPSHFWIGFYSLQISANADCSGPFVTAFDVGSKLELDLTTNPEIVRADIAAGTYRCIAMRISDVIEFESAVSGGACVTGTRYAADTYRAGNEEVDFKDPSGAAIPATGTREAPSNDMIWAFFSTDPAAVIARGYSPSQVVTLTGALVVPGATTFYWDGTNSVTDDPGVCWIQPGAQGFR